MTKRRFRCRGARPSNLARYFAASMGSANGASASRIAFSSPTATTVTSEAGKYLRAMASGPKKGPHPRTPCVDSSLLLRDILYHVSVRTSKIVTAAALLICLLCPIAESFDQWDHTVQTGNDSEYTLVVVGLCVGVAHTFARFVLASLTAEVVSDIILHFSSHSPLAPVARSPFFIVPISLGPPALALRI